MPVAFIRDLQLEQYGPHVFIGIRFRGDGSYHTTNLLTSYYGHVLGFTEPFEDEESASFAFEAARRYLEGLA